MKLTDSMIYEKIKKKEIKIEPEFKKNNLRPYGLRLHLGNEIIKYEDNQVIDLSTKDSPKFETINIKDKPFELKPGKFILGSTKEKIQTESNILCAIDGRTTIARLGLSIHITARITDGTQHEMHSIVLEIYNHSNVTYLIKGGLAIGCITFETLPENTSGENYHGQYLGQDKVIAPRTEFDIYKR